MNPILPEELTGLIDGELAPERAAEIENALRENADLRREHERLLATHGRLMAFAADAASAARLEHAKPVSADSGGLARPVRWAGAAMLTLRLSSKLLPASLGVGLGMLALAIVAGGITVWLIRKSDAEAAQLQTGLPA